MIFLSAVEITLWNLTHYCDQDAGFDLEFVHRVLCLDYQRFFYQKVDNSKGFL